MDIVEQLRKAALFDETGLFMGAALEIKRLRNALEKYDCLHKCTEPCALYHLEKAKEDSMPHMICGWWASEAVMEKK